MITEGQQEQAGLFALDALIGDELRAFEQELEVNAELRELVRSFANCMSLVAATIPQQNPPAGLKEKVLKSIEALSSGHGTSESREKAPGFAFVAAGGSTGWKALPVPGAWIKLLSVNQDDGYVIALGKLEPGTRYPAHRHEGAENLFVLSGDLRIGDHVMRPGDFHHSDAGTEHGENWSAEGCTLMAILSLDHALAKFAMAS